MNSKNRKFIEKHIQKIIQEFNFSNRKQKCPNECLCYTGKICHNISEKRLNCFLCYCPEYDSNLEEGGCKINSSKGKWFFNEKLTKGKIWDCSNCEYPHEEKVVKKYLKKLFFG